MRKYLFALSFVLTELVIISQACWANFQKPEDYTLVELRGTLNTFSVVPCPITVDIDTTNRIWRLYLMNHTEVPLPIIVVIQAANGNVCETIWLQLGEEKPTREFYDGWGDCKLRAEAYFFVPISNDPIGICEIIETHVEKTPSLTQEGFIVLAGLILGIGIYLLVRRRKPISA